MFAFLIYLILWSVVIFLAYAIFGKWALVMIGISAFASLCKWGGPWLIDFAHFLQERKDQEAAKKLQEQKDSGKIIDIDERR